MIGQVTISQDERFLCDISKDATRFLKPPESRVLLIVVIETNHSFSSLILSGEERWFGRLWSFKESTAQSWLNQDPSLYLSLNFLVCEIRSLDKVISKFSTSFHILWLVSSRSIAVKQIHNANHICKFKFLSSHIKKFTLTIFQVSSLH